LTYGTYSQGDIAYKALGDKISQAADYGLMNVAMLTKQPTEVAQLLYGL